MSVVDPNKETQCCHKNSMSQSMSQPQFATFTQGTDSGWYYELIHTSTNKVKKINDFMKPYEINGRDVDPDVCLLLNNTRKFMERSVMSLRPSSMKRIPIFALANLVFAIFIHVLSEKSVLGILMLRQVFIKKIISNILLTLIQMIIMQINFHK